MDPRRSTRSDDNIPTIGDYSAAHDARLREDGSEARASRRAAETPAPQRAPDAPAPRRSPPGDPRRARNDSVLIDPSDVHRHTQRLRQRERKGPYAKLLRYGAIALAAAVAFGVYWNFESLRQIEVSFRPLWRSSGGVPATSRDSERIDAELQTESVEAPAILTVDVLPVELDAPIDAASRDALSAEPEARIDADTVDAEPETSIEAEDAAVEVTASDLAPASPPPPPPEPETFAFGSSTYTVAESETAVAVQILRSGGGGESSVSWWTTGGTATPDADYADLGTIVTPFPAGTQNRTIRIPIIGDRIVEGPESFYVHLGPADGADAPAEPMRTEIVIIDDD